jgi:hypothetical protein
LDCPDDVENPGVVDCGNEPVIDPRLGIDAAAGLQVERFLDHENSILHDSAFSTHTAASHNRDVSIEWPMNVEREHITGDLKRIDRATQIAGDESGVKQ